MPRTNSTTKSVARLETEQLLAADLVADLLEDMPDPGSNQWPTWKRSDGNELAATPAQVQVALLLAHGVRHTVVSAALGISVSMVGRTARSSWVKEWLAQRTKQRLLELEGLAVQTLEELLREGHSEKVRSDLVQWLLGRVETEREASGSGANTGITLNITTGSETKTVVVDGTSESVNPQAISAG